MNHSLRVKNDPAFLVMTEVEIQLGEKKREPSDASHKIDLCVSDICIKGRAIC